MELHDHVLNELEENISSLKETLGMGLVKDWAEFQHLRGKIQGLLTAKRSIEDLVRKKETDD